MTGSSIVSGITGYLKGEQVPPELYPKVLDVTYTIHAYQESHDDEYLEDIGLTCIPRPSILEVEKMEVTEVRFEDGVPHILVCRAPVSRAYDATYVVDLQKKTIVTTWLNPWNQPTRHSENRYKN